MDRFRLFIITILLLSVLKVYAFSEEEITHLSLSDCLNLGLLNSLDIKIAKIESKIKGQDILLSESVFDTILEGKIAYEDDKRATPSTLAGTKNLTNTYEFSATKELTTGTELTLEYSNIRDWTNSPYVVNNPLHTAEIGITVEQPILKNFFGYVDRGKVKLSRIEADIAGIETLNRIEESIADIEKAYWKLVFTYQNLALREDLLKQAEELFNTYKEHLKIGLVESTELYETEANVWIRKTELVIVRNELKNASNNLKLLLNEDGEFLILPKEKLVNLGDAADLIYSLNEGFSANRDYLIKKKNISAKKVKLKMKENSLWPEVDLIGTFAINGVHRKFERANKKLTTDKFPYYYAGIEVKIPLDNQEARGEYNKAVLEKEKAILELVQTEKEIINAIDEEVRDVNLNLENARYWTEIKKIQEAKFQDEKKKLKYGRSNSKTIIDYQNDFILAAINEQNALLQYYFAFIDLENAKDMLLAKVGVLEL